MTSLHTPMRMKRMKDLPKLKTSTMALLSGLTIGLTLVAAALIAMATGSDLALHWIHKRVISSTLAYQHS
jgi:hypothetical protein